MRAHAPAVHTLALNGYNYWAADRRHPCSVLGMLYALEVIASVYGGPFAAAIRESLLLEGDRGVSFIGSHATLDAAAHGRAAPIVNQLRATTRCDGGGGVGARQLPPLHPHHRGHLSTDRERRCRRRRRPAGPALQDHPPGVDLGPAPAARAHLRASPIQCYSLAAMGELQQMLADISANPGLVRHFVMTSDVPRVFNFGGDLALFVLLVRAGDVDSLKLYGKRCVDLVWWMENAANLGVHTTVLSQGDTLGGGLESVLPFHKVIFERSAQAGFPEVLFNLFPGMGAWDFTIRKAGFAVANEMILSGRLYSADELHTARLVDLVVDDGQGEAAIDAVVRDVDPRLRGTLAALRAQRLAAPITLRVADGHRRPVGRDRAGPDRPRPAADGAPGARPGAQGRWRRGRRGRGTQAHGAGERLGRVTPRAPTAARPATNVRVRS